MRRTKARALVLAGVVLTVVLPLVAIPLTADEPPVLLFEHFFKRPIGPRGLEPTDRLLDLRDQRVRIEGYMVKEEEPQPGLFMLTPMPLALGELADGPADYLPAATLFVHVLGGDDGGKIVRYHPGRWTVVGFLRLGPWPEPNGRVSYVRLIVDDLRAIHVPAS